MEDEIYQSVGDPQIESMEEIRSKELDDIQMIDHIKIKQIESKKK